jgi:hypothetical protein
VLGVKRAKERQCPRGHASAGSRGITGHPGSFRSAEV